MERLQNLFDKFDYDANGSINAIEFKIILNILDIIPECDNNKKYSFDDLLNYIRINRSLNGKINLDNLKAIMRNSHSELDINVIVNEMGCAEEISVQKIKDYCNTFNNSE
jgi:Ca2+-binding EF-hand superfamily protein